MRLFHLSPESTPSTTFHESVLSSVSSVRDSIPKEHHAYFETLRQEIIDFAQTHGIPREALAKHDALRKAAEKLSTQDLEQLANLLERFEHLIVKKEPWENKEAIEYVETYYHLKEQYDFQAELLERVGILSKEGAILGIDNKKYPIPTLEQIAIRLFERREELKTKHDQGFTKLLLVPFGMSLDTLQETLKQFLLSYKQSYPAFDLNTDEPLLTLGGYQGVDTGDSPKLVYYPQSFTKEDHQGKTKMQILEEQKNNPDSFPGWIIHLLQPSNQGAQDTETPKGFAPIPREGQGTSHPSRPPLEAGQSPNEYLSILQSSKEDENSPYFQESGMTPEDWIMAFMIHLQETGKPLDNTYNPTDTESVSCFTEAFSPSSIGVSGAYWSCLSHRVNLNKGNPGDRHKSVGVRFLVMI